MSKKLHSRDEDDDEPFEDNDEAENEEPEASRSIKSSRISSAATREEKSEKRKERPSLLEELDKVNKMLDEADRLKKLKTAPEPQPEPETPPPATPAAAALSAPATPAQLPVINIVLPPNQNTTTFGQQPTGRTQFYTPEVFYSRQPVVRPQPVTTRPISDVEIMSPFGGSAPQGTQRFGVTDQSATQTAMPLEMPPLQPPATTSPVSVVTTVPQGDPIRMPAADVPPAPPPRNVAYYDHRLNVLLDPDQYYNARNTEARALRFSRPYGAPTIPMAAPPNGSPFEAYTISNAEAYGPTSQRTINRWNPTSLAVLTPEQQQAVRAAHAQQIRRNDAAPAIYTVLTPEEIRRTERARRRYDEYRLAEQNAEQTRSAVRAGQAMPFRDPIRIRALQAVTQAAGTDFQRVLRDDINVTAWRAGELAPFPPSSLRQ